VAEIGCGTGQAAVSMAEHKDGCHGRRTGAGLAAVARRRLTSLPSAEVVTASFEGWDPHGARFGGCHWAHPADAAPFWTDVRQDYRAVGYDGDPAPRPSRPGPVASRPRHPAPGPGTPRSDQAHDGWSGSDASSHTPQTRKALPLTRAVLASMTCAVHPSRVMCRWPSHGTLGSGTSVTQVDPLEPADRPGEWGMSMAIGPVQRGPPSSSFSHPGFHGKIIAERERLAENDLGIAGQERAGRPRPRLRGGPREPPGVAAVRRHRPRRRLRISDSLISPLDLVRSACCRRPAWWRVVE
jgi:hypothetical protein